MSLNNLKVGSCTVCGGKEFSFKPVLWSSLIQDADLEYDPSEYPILLQPLIENHADVVFGSRFMGGKPHWVVYFWHMLGNKFLTLLSNILTNINHSYMETCHKAFRREVIQNISIQESRFGFEPEITAKAAKLGLRIYEVGISYYGRTNRTHADFSR
jgi:Glycosyl transferase family 2